MFITSFKRFMAERIGILGGSFDPVHLGHMVIAQDALEGMQLAAVYFIPNAQAPLKERVPAASNAQRLAMVQCAIAGHPQFQVLDYELKQGGMNYTVDTARWLKAQWPQREFYWIIGADQVAQLPAWRSIATIFEYVDFIVLQRPGYTFSQPVELPRDKIHRVAGHCIDISSSEVRQRIAAGKCVSFFLSESVRNYINKYSLYEK